MPILPTRRTGAALCVVLATSVLTVALACSDSLAPHTPRGSGGPRFLYQDPALESPPSASGSIDLPPLVTTVNGMSTVVGHFPYGTVVRFDVSGSHILSSVTGRDGSGSYGLKGRSCQTGDVGTTSFAGTNTGWDACNAPIGSTQTNYSDYISVVGDVYLYHAGDGGSTPPYPDCTHDCFYIGGGSELTLTRIEASLDLTTSDAPAQSAGVYVVSPGTSLMFGWAVSPATVSSAGGDIKLGAVTNSSSWEITRPAGNVVGCPYFPFASGNNYRYCQVRADSALKVKLTAITNGAWKSKSVQIFPRRNFRLQGPTSAEVGDTIAYTATLDGQAIRATRWVWMPSDTSTHETSNGWDDPTSTSRLKSMATSGKMTAYIDYAGGGTDSARVTTTVSDKFTLTASASNVAYGDSVTFTPLLDGAPTVVSRWKYVPADTGSRDSTACAGQTSMCVKRMQRSGTMWAWLASDSSRSATAYVTVDAGCVPGPTFSTAGASAIAPGAATVTAPRSTMRAQPAHSPLASRDVICGGDGGSALGTGNDSTRRFIVRQNLQAGVVSSVPAGDSLYRLGDTVHYRFSAAPGFVAPAVFLDTAVVADSGALVVNGDHEFDVATDSDYAARPELQDVAARVRALIWASDPPAAYADYARWYVSARASDPSLDQKLSLASLLVMSFSADSDSVAAYEEAAFRFDSAMAGTYYTMEGTAASPTIRFQRRSEYVPVITNRVGSSPRLDRTAGQRSFDVSGAPLGTTVVYVNGMATPWLRLRASWTNLGAVVASLNWPNSHTSFVWNRDYPSQFSDHVMRAGCTDYDMARFAATHNWLMVLAQHERCLRLKVTGTFKFRDLVESIEQEAQVYGASESMAEDALAVAYKVATLHHDSAQDVILVTHSQGNLMAAQALQLLPTVPYGVDSLRCTEELSLASPINRLGFRARSPGLAAEDLDGFDMYYDILLQLLLPNDFTPYHHSVYEPVALASSDAASRFGGPLAAKLVLLMSGLDIHDVDVNYFTQSDGVMTLRDKLGPLYQRCPH